MASVVALILPVLLLVGSINPAWCQADATSSSHRISQSSGLKATIGAINVLKQGGTQLAIQLILKNITSNRLYLFVTGDHQAALSDGEVFILQDVIGMTYCRLLYPQEQATEFCLDQHGGDLNYYSYIDPGEEADLSLRYTIKSYVPREYVPSGSLSFRMIIASRIAYALPNTLAAQADPQKAISPPQLIILNFPLTPLSFGN